MNPNLDTHPTDPLDLLTLEAVRVEVKRRAKAARLQWRLEPAGAGLIQAQTLDLLSAWLDAAITEADAALDQHYTLTEAGYAALAATEKGAA